MGLVDDDEVPASSLGVELFEPIFIAGKLVQLGDEPRVLEKRIPGGGGLDERVGQDIEAKAELRRELGLPLLDEASGRDDEAALEVAAELQLANEEAGHDGLARARIVGQNEAKWLPRQKRFVHRRHLVRKRLHVRPVHRHHRIEEMGELNSQRFGRELDRFRLGIERPRACRTDEGELQLVVPEERLPAGRPIRT